MADEVRVRAWLGIDFGGTRDGLGVGTEPPDEVTFDYSGNEGDGLARVLRRTQLITNTLEALAFGDDVAVGGYLLVVNQGPDTVHLKMISSGGAGTAFSTLGVGDVTIVKTQTGDSGATGAQTPAIGDEARLSFFVISGPPPV